VYASRENKEIDIWLSALCALLVSAKFVQMKYPSADSLNQATDNAYTYDLIIAMEARLLNVINWELLQYPVFEFVNFFLAQGCLFPNDEILQRPGSAAETVPATIEHAANIRKYAEFFTDFCVQESDLVAADAFLTTCAILAFTRKHLNLRVIWTEEMLKLTSLPFATIKTTFGYIEQKYSESFPDHARTQEKISAKRQRLEQPVATKSVDLSSCKAATTTKVTASATTHPTTHHVNSEQSLETKYAISTCQFEQFDSTLKKEAALRAQLNDRQRSFDSNQENFAKANITDHFNLVAAEMDSKLKSYEELAAHFLEQHEAESSSAKDLTQKIGMKSSEQLKKSARAPQLPIGPSAQTARIQYQRDHKKLTGATFDLGHQATQDKLLRDVSMENTTVVDNS